MPSVACSVAGADAMALHILARTCASCRRPQLCTACVPDCCTSACPRAPWLTRLLADVPPALQILYVDPASNKGASDFFGLADSDLPAMAIHDPAANGKYLLKTAALDKVEAWLSDFHAGTRLPPICGLWDTPDAFLAIRVLRQAG